MIHLDTNFLIQALVPSSSAEAKLQAWRKDGEDLGICAIAWSEFLCGPMTNDEEALAKALFPLPEPFLSTDAYKAAELFMRQVVVHAVWRIARSPQWPCVAVLVSPRPTRRTSLCFKLMD